MNMGLLAEKKEGERKGEKYKIMQESYYFKGNQWSSDIYQVKSD